MHIDFPTEYVVDYPQKNINYYDAYGQKKLIPLLLAASKGFCMYCGKSLTKDSDIVYQVEHSVDKDGNIDQKLNEITFLTHCKYNLSISCTKCNIECKKKIEKISFDEIPHTKDCKHEKCKSRCREYDALRDQYIRKNAIILQPEGVYKDGLKYGIEYNLISQLFEPKNCRDNWEAFFFISNHILRFKLNSERYSEEFINCAADVVNYYQRGITDSQDMLHTIREHKNDNILGFLFAEWIEKIMNNNCLQEVVDICETLVLSSALS